jgi:hypothetical protein
MILIDRRIVSKIVSGRSRQDRVGVRSWQMLKAREAALSRTSAAIHNLCCYTQPLLLYTTSTAVHNLCCYTQPLLLYTTSTAVHNLCCCTQPLLLYTTSTAVHNLCCYTQPLLLCRTTGVFGGSSEKPQIYMQPGLESPSYRLGIVANQIGYRAMYGLGRNPVDAWMTRT